VTSKGRGLFLGDPPAGPTGFPPFGRRN